MQTFTDIIKINVMNKNFKAAGNTMKAKHAVKNLFTLLVQEVQHINYSE